MDADGFIVTLYLIVIFRFFDAVMDKVPILAAKPAKISIPGGISNYYLVEKALDEGSSNGRRSRE